MRIAAISDIHGDLRSLKAVWRDIESRGLAENIVLNAGDTVAYGSENAECIAFVQDHAYRIISVGGNYDYSVAKFPNKAEEFRKKWAKHRPEKFEAIERASNEISEDARQWLKDLPPQVVVDISSVVFSISHYAPIEGKRGLHAMTDDSMLLRIAAQLDPQISVVVTGHTHSEFIRQAGRVLFVNPGSVGRSYGRPTYAEIAVEPGMLPTARIHQCRVTP